ncbi:hypothetical protein C8J56DRAFT_940239 [Mycena floridula]|nr:hypothetical protein C8J56DRAFT_940239 [Mycena floridula]
MRSSTTFTALSLLVSVAIVAAAPSLQTRGPKDTIKDLTHEENHLQGLKKADKRVQGKEKKLEAKIQKNSRAGKAGAAKVAKEKGAMKKLKQADGGIQKKEKKVGKKIKGDVKKLRARDGLETVCLHMECGFLSIDQFQDIESRDIQERDVGDGLDDLE